MHGGKKEAVAQMWLGTPDSYRPFEMCVDLSNLLRTQLKNHNTNTQ